MRRGEVWEAHMGGKIGKRPVVILTRSKVIPHLSKVVVAEITTRSKGYPTQVSIDHLANLRKESFVSCDCLHTFPKELLKRYIGDLPPNVIEQINQAVLFALELIG